MAINLGVNSHGNQPWRKLTWQSTLAQTHMAINLGANSHGNPHQKLFEACLKTILETVGNC
jgi:hypothetical protein